MTQSLRDEYSSNRSHDETYEEYLERIVGLLRSNVKQAAEWFRDYEADHQRKADAEPLYARKVTSQEKADRNRDRAAQLEALL